MNKQTKKIESDLYRPVIPSIAPVPKCDLFTQCYPIEENWLSLSISCKKLLAIDHLLTWRTCQALPRLRLPWGLLSCGILFLLCKESFILYILASMSNQWDLSWLFQRKQLSILTNSLWCVVITMPHFNCIVPITERALAHMSVHLHTCVLLVFLHRLQSHEGRSCSCCMKGYDAPAHLTQREQRVLGLCFREILPSVLL